MSAPTAVPMVRCRLDGSEGPTAETVRFIPLAEYELWRHLMETRHGRRVTVEEVSIWIAEDATSWNSGFTAEDLQPVVRLQLERPGPYGVPVPMVRYFPAETYPQAQEALLSHFDRVPCRVVAATPGYFVPAERLPRRERSARSA